MIKGFWKVSLMGVSPAGSKYHYGIYLEPQNTLQVDTIIP